uniref:Biotin synthase n=1 Tax=Candidatus Kentrum sp. TUN TaxID=2126343 RepID=A0A450ZVZ8_9GAMM|nr:MAG: biotin synthase [Candidatus Kentron sp. TUN]VFK52960.1 MAG: biotin synthase [Candidatus Kentron sp. TUN]VFK57955.1 MAG: biotin synthase [Candidatus Kentron sp. TUN]
MTSTTISPTGTLPALEEQTATLIRHDWRKEEVEAVLAQPFNDLVFQAQAIHRTYFDPNELQISSILSIKTGACSEDCAYCPQSARYQPGQTEVEALMPVDMVLEAARQARDNGATRFCMGAAWRCPKPRELDQVLTMIEGIKSLGMETCTSLGMLDKKQAKQLKDAGLDYYNHNLDTSPEFYGEIITTRTYEDRLETLENVRDAGINVCCGGIIGMGENKNDRIGLMLQLANMPKHPDSVPINLLLQIEGTPLEGAEPIDPLDFVRIVALARILMPKAYVRLSAGREKMSDELHVLCYLSGANSIFYGEKLLTAKNTEATRDRQLMKRLGMRPLQRGK